MYLKTYLKNESGNLYPLHVKVHYSELNLIIDKQDVNVMGDKLSQEQKAEIQEKAILALPVKANGGFKLVYNNNKQVSKGQAFINNDNYRVEDIESVFEQKRDEVDIGGFQTTHPVFVCI